MKITVHSEFFTVVSILQMMIKSGVKSGAEFDEMYSRFEILAREIKKAIWMNDQYGSNKEKHCKATKEQC